MTAAPPARRTVGEALAAGLRTSMRVTLTVVVLLLAGWAAGQLMLASHLDPDTIIAVGAMSAAVVFLVGLGVTARGRDRGRS